MTSSTSMLPRCAVNYLECREDKPFVSIALTMVIEASPPPTPNHSSLFSLSQLPSKHRRSKARTVKQNNGASIFYAQMCFHGTSLIIWRIFSSQSNSKHLVLFIYLHSTIELINKCHQLKKKAIIMQHWRKRKKQKSLRILQCQKTDLPKKKDFTLFGFFFFFSFFLWACFYKGPWGVCCGSLNRTWEAGDFTTTPCQQIPPLHISWACSRETAYVALRDTSHVNVPIKIRPTKVVEMSSTNPPLKLRPQASP